MGTSRQSAVIIQRAVIEDWENTISFMFFSFFRVILLSDLPVKYILKIKINQLLFFFYSYRKNTNHYFQEESYAYERSFDAGFFFAGRSRDRMFFKRGISVCGLFKKGGTDILADTAVRSDELWGFAVSVVLNLCRKPVFY